MDRHGFRSGEDIIEVKSRDRRRGPVGIMARGGWDWTWGLCPCGGGWYGNVWVWMPMIPYRYRVLILGSFTLGWDNFMLRQKCFFQCMQLVAGYSVGSAIPIFKYRLMQLHPYPNPCQVAFKCGGPYQSRGLFVILQVHFG